MKDIKTNVMRILDKANADYCVRTYEAEIDGEYIPLTASNSIEKIGVENERCFKTIVTKAQPSVYYVFMLPIAQELDLKKCARAVGEKKVEPIAVKELLPLTGYVRGGCSPIGMKKQFSTVIDETCILFDYVVFSAGKRGVMVDVKVDDLFALIPIVSADITN